VLDRARACGEQVPFRGGGHDDGVIATCERKAAGVDVGRGGDALLRRQRRRRAAAVAAVAAVVVVVWVVEGGGVVCA
jgi:hypothetical protein